jgi:hypothetical protein
MRQPAFCCSCSCAVRLCDVFFRHCFIFAPR